MLITDSYVKKLSAQGFHVTNKLRGEEVPRPVQKFIQQRMLNQKVKLKRSQTPSKREPTNFHITPCHDIKEPQIIHRNRSQPSKSIYYFPINDQTTQIYQSQSRSYIDNLINHSFSTKKQELSHISRTMVSKFTTPKQQCIVTSKELDKDNIASLINTTKAIQTENDINHELNFLTAFKMHTNIALDNSNKSLKECYQDFKLKIDIKDQKSIIHDLINQKANKKSNYYIQKQNQTPWLWQSTNKQNKFQIQKVHLLNNKDIQQVISLPEQRRLSEPEEEVIIRSIHKLIHSPILSDILLKQNFQKTMQEMLTSLNLEYLLSFALVIEQIQYHWKIMASQQVHFGDFTEDELQLMVKKGQILDLRNKTPLIERLTQYL